MTHPASPIAAPVVATGSDGHVNTGVGEGVGVIEFGHPKGNSLPATVLRDLAAAITAAGQRADIRVIVLRSHGEGPFCAGASFDELVAIQDAAAGREFFMGFARVIVAMTRCPKPIVTRVHGKVVGGGVGIVAASDYVMAVETASIRLSELAIGIGPFVIGPVVERKAGAAGLATMAIDADWRDAKWAERHGLYARVYDSLHALDAALLLFAQKLAASNPEALEHIKRVTWLGTEHWPALLEERATLSGRLVLSQFTRDAIAAFGTRGR